MKEKGKKQRQKGKKGDANYSENARARRFFSV